MSALFRCPCGKPLQAPAGYAGRQVKCPACGRTLNIPPGVAPPAAAATAAPRAPGGRRAGQDLPREAAASALQAALPAGPRRRSALPVPGRTPGQPPTQLRRPRRSLGPLLVLAAVVVVVLCGGVSTAGLLVVWLARKAADPGPRAAVS